MTQTVKIEGVNHDITTGKTIVKVKNDESLYKIDRVVRPGVNYYATNIDSSETSMIYIEDIIEVTNDVKSLDKEKTKELIKELDETAEEIAKETSILEHNFKKAKAKELIKRSENPIGNDEKALLKALLKYSLSKIDDYIDSLQ